MREPSEDQFLKDVGGHRMNVSRDDGMYRHLQFKRIDRGWHLWFDLVTWPGFLTICGDMGTWTFARVPDMFDFFRSQGGLKINPSYWAEKLQHGNFSGRQGGKVWDDDLFRSRLLERIKDSDLTDEQMKYLKGRIEEEIFSQSGEHFLLHAAYEFTCCLEPGCIEMGFCSKRDQHRRKQFQFDSCELPDGTDYSYHFIWCLYAIVWGIQQYDASKPPTLNAVAAEAR